MMPIKFRAWSKEAKAMVAPENRLGICLNFIGNIYVAGARMTEDFVLMQFTGLLDKNGKEVYEGDLVEWTSLYISTEAIGEVTFFEGGWFVQGSKENGWLNDCLSIEVIGNIWEHPDLLNEVTP